MAVTKFLARDLLFEIEVPGSGAGWTPIKGLVSATHTPSSTDADSTDFDSVGRHEHMIAERSDEWKLSGWALEDTVAGTRDPGQAAVEALAQEVAAASIGTFRVTSPGGNVITFSASAEVALESGGHNDIAKWECTLKTTGALAYT